MTAAPTSDGRSRRLLRRPDPRRRRMFAGAAVAMAILAATGLSFAGAAGPSLKDRIDAAESDAGTLTERIDSHTARIASLTVQARQAGVRAMELDAEAEAASLDATHAEFEATQAEAKQGIAAVAQAQSESQVDLAAVQDEIAALEAAQAEQQAEQEGAPLYEGGPYAIPTYIVMCESGGNYRALNPSSGAGGAYQILPSTWRAYGGQGLPHQAPQAEQDRIAGQI